MQGNRIWAIKEGEDIKADFWASGGSVLRATQALQQHAYSCWADAVEAYTPKILDRGEDKLIAISGIARHVQHAFKNDHVAGL